MTTEKDAEQPNIKLQQAREDRGLTQEELAVQLGVSLRTVKRWEQGEARPQKSLRQQLSQLLKKSYLELGLSTGEPDLPPKEYVQDDNHISRSMLTGEGIKNPVKNELKLSDFHHLTLLYHHIRGGEKFRVTPPIHLWHQKKLFISLSSIGISVILLALVFIIAVPYISSSSRTSSCANAFSDNFDGKLDARWQQINLSSFATYTVASKGPLILSAPPSSDLNPQHDNFNAPRLLQAITGDFTVTAKIEFQPIINWQSAGILLWQDNNTFLRVERGEGQKGSGVDFQQWDELHHRSSSISTFVDHRTNTGSVELSVQRQGDVFTASWRVPGQGWQPLGKTVLHFEKLMVGLDLVTDAPSQTPEITASYDYFKVSCTKS